MTIGSPKTDLRLLHWWHALLLGSFAVAYVTADEDTYAMHQFAGYLLLAVLVARPLLALGRGERSPLRLRRPDVGALLRWLKDGGARTALNAWSLAIIGAVLAVSALSGWLADGWNWVEEPHEAASELALIVVLAHGALMTVVLRGRVLISRLRESFS